ncbi:thioredoxin-like protein [Calycina marina]|uniref:Thioredoxin-like protein n=1 Tax=Calycina marina TaxID=1763456 RepID=A0A9P7Z198_9HELO|nr:thioredoxin-like protein [Calycina marina]
MSVNIGSSAELSKLLSMSAIVVTDFYADWCGPCKAISPTYESLAKKHSQPKRVTFTKVNVDNQQEISQRYGVRAMPTFIIFQNGSVIETIQGADPNKLTSAIEKAVKMAGPAKPAYSSVGHTLGGKPASAKPVNYHSVLSAVIAFFGLYFYSLLSLDAYGAAEKSPFNVNRQPAPPAPRTSASIRTGAATQIGKKLGTISDFSSS